MTDELNPYPGNLKQHTVLNAEGLADKNRPIPKEFISKQDDFVPVSASGFAYEVRRIAHDNYADAIREVAQPIADELAAVKEERDELRRVLEAQAAWFQDIVLRITENTH